MEHDQGIERRVIFNRPFGLIDVEMKAAAEVIPELSSDRRHILWLDYDDHLHEWMLQDLGSALNRLSAGSIVLITIDVEPPIRVGTPAEWEAYFRHEAAPYIPHDWTTENFGREKLPSVVQQLVAATIDSALAYREEVQFSPLFSFLYEDGHMMYTAGGMLTTRREKRQLREADFDDAHYIRTSLETEPYRIVVPNLTRKERVYLDAKMPAPAGWSPPDFELDDADLEAYRKIYRFYPNYVEVF